MNLIDSVVRAKMRNQWKP